MTTEPTQPPEPPIGKRFDAASQQLVDWPEDPRLAAPVPPETTEPDGKSPSDPHAAPPSATNADTEPNFVILAGPKPEAGRPPTFVEVGRVVARGTDEAKRAGRKLPTILETIQQHGAVALAACPVRSWSPELVEPPPPAEAPPLKVTPLS